MVVDVTMCKEEGKPFGFRLIGGSDFEIPLTCSRVVEGSTAEKCGMLEGDVVVRINDKPTINMSHEDAHRELVAAGTQFVLGVLRGTNLLPEAEDEPSVEQNDVCLQKEQERIDKIISDASVTDEEIAELLSGEAEVLKGHNILGVNFQKMMPKAGVFKQSEVFQVLNDEQLKSKAEQEREEKYQWTTFLQKPQRPPPTRSFQTPINTYKPTIVKQPKPKCAPDYRAPTPEPTSIEVQETYQTENIVEQQEERVERNEVQEHIECQSYVAEVSSQTFVTTTTMTSTTTTSEEQVLSFEELAADATGEPLNEELIAEEVKVQEDEISVVSSAMAEQLANVQTQLLALSHLPRTIQSTLDEIAKQLEALIPPKLKQKSVEPEIKVEEEFVVVTSEETQTEVEQSSATIVEVTSEVHSVEETITTTTTVMEEKVEQDDSIHYSKAEIEDYEDSQAKFRALWEMKREKQEPTNAKTDLSAELKQKVTEDRQMKQKKARAFRGLQAQERPLVLPGGRKWRNEKDAMNEEMIAEIISSQAELIMGQTLGVNFLKYQKPEKDLSFLKNSETYRTIHHLTPKENGIEKRPAVVAAEADLLKCASPNPLNQNSS